MSRRRLSDSNVFLLMIAAIIIIVFIALNLLWARNNPPPEPVPAPVPATPSTVWQTTNLPPPLEHPAAVTVQAVRVIGQLQITTPPAPPPTRPVAIPGDCGSWEAIFRWYGATDAEIYFFFVSTPWGRHNIISGESMCGLRFRNPDTSDTGICQLNGVHRPWVLAEFGLRLGYGVSEAEASNPEYARACLYLLRGGHEPGSMRGACNWRTGRFCS